MAAYAYTGSLTGIVSHTRRVQSLYKRSLRHIQAFIHDRAHFRLHATELRQRFEENRKVSTAQIAGELVLAGEEEFFKKSHYQPLYFTDSPGGVAYQRTVTPPDWVVDHWHPLEKAQYPEYFARREKRKEEYVKEWLKKYGETKSTPSSPTC